MQHLLDAKNVPRPCKMASDLVGHQWEKIREVTYAYEQNEMCVSHVAPVKKCETLLPFQTVLQTIFGRTNFIGKLYKTTHTHIQWTKRNKTLSHDVKWFFSAAHPFQWVPNQLLIQTTNFNSINIFMAQLRIALPVSVACTVTSFGSFLHLNGSTFWSTDD